MTIKIKTLLLLMLSCSLWSQQYSIKQIDSIITVASNINNQDAARSLALSNKVYTYSKNINYPLGIIKGLENMAYCYYMMGKPDKAILYSVATEKKAIQEDNYMYVAYALRIKAASYSLLGQEDEARKVLDEALIITDKIPPSSDFHKIKGLLYQAYGTIIVNQKNKAKYPLLLKYYKKSLAEFLKTDSSLENESNLAGAYSNLGSEYSDTKMHDSAYYYLNKSLALSIELKNVNNEYFARYNIGNLLYIEKKYNEAIPYFIEVEKKSRLYKDPYTATVALDGLYNAYKKINNPKWNDYFIKLQKLKDSLSIAEKAAAKIPLQQVVKEKEAKFSETKSSLYIIISISIFLFVIALFIAFRYLKNYKVEKSEKLKKEISLIEQNKKVAELETRVNDGFDEVLELAKNDDTSFLTRFKEVYPEFYNKLAANESLTPGDLKFSALLKLNFSSKEIAYYTHASIRTIESRKHRIRKKLGILSTEDLNLWMMAY